MNASSANNEIPVKTYFSALNNQQLVDLVLKFPRLIESTLTKADEDILWDEITKDFNNLQNNAKFPREVLKDRWKLLKSSLPTNKLMFENKQLTTEMKMGLENISAEAGETNENTTVLNKPQLLLESKIPFIKTLPVEQLHALEQEIYEMIVAYELEVKAEWRQITENKIESVVKECEEIFKELHLQSETGKETRFKFNYEMDAEPMSNMDSANLVEAVLMEDMVIPETPKRKQINVRKDAVIKIELAEAQKYVRNFTIRLKKNYGDQYSVRRLRPRKTLN